MSLSFFFLNVNYTLDFPFQRMGRGRKLDFDAELMRRVNPPFMNDFYSVSGLLKEATNIRNTIAIKGCTFLQQC